MININRRNRDSLILKYNVDTNGNPISLEITDEKHQVSVIHNVVQLMQIPDEVYRMTVRNESGALMYEVFDVEKVDVQNYLVDYAHGVVYFHPSHKGKTMTFNYHGRGVEMVHADRVMFGDENHFRDLSSMIDQFNEMWHKLGTLSQGYQAMIDEFEKMKEIVYAEQPLLNLQQQITLLKEENKDHVRWKNSGIRVVASEANVLYNTAEDNLVKTDT